MPLIDYVVASDRFKAEHASPLSFAFPCCCCAYRHRKVTDEPCRSCGHNMSMDKEKADGRDDD